MEEKKLNIVLIHGWNHLNYSNHTDSEDIWNNRKPFVDMLKNKYNVHIVTLPGFCGQKEPKEAWNLSDFANFFEEYLKNNKIKADFVLGYSFGAAVALEHKIKYKNSSKLVLVSPAICRKYKRASSERNKLKHFSKMLPNILYNFLKDKYISKVLKNPFYANGSKFIKQTYLNIVDLDLSANLLKLKKDDFILIFGDKDTATPSDILLSKYPPLKSNMILLSNGSHDIANTNTIELCQKIDNFINKKSF